MTDTKRSERAASLYAKALLLGYIGMMLTAIGLIAMLWTSPLPLVIAGAGMWVMLTAILAVVTQLLVKI